MKQLPEALRPLAQYRQFILWKPVPSTTQPGKIDKKPVHPQTGWVSDPHDPTIWVDADTAISRAAGGTLGVGFVFTASDPFFFLDIDGALGADNKWSPLANQLCETFKGAAVEVSQSGKGLHIIGSGEYPPHSCRNTPLGLEFYTEKRFVALTGIGAQGSAAARPQAAIDWLTANYFPPSATVTSSAEWTDEPCEGYGGPEDDAALIEKMLASRSIGAAFGGRASIQQLWAADGDALAASYPDPRGFDHSSADAALCQHLAFWTGKNCERMDRLFRLSGLDREKWENRPDYRERTIGHAVSHCANIYSAGKAPSPPPTKEQTEAATDQGVTLKSGYQYLAVNQLIKLFKDCVYIQNLHRIFTPDGSLLKPEQFRAVYGGYVFALDSSNDKTTTKAWEAFTESQAAQFPRAHDICFRPEHTPGSLIKEEGRVLLNTYTPIETYRVKGDPAPVLDLLSRILPDPRDRDILLAYMAACVQYPGVKFQWAPLLQGAEGNGKTLFARCVAHAVGHRYTHIKSANDLGNVFNSWVQGNLFIGIEDVHVPDHKREIIEILKPLITNDRVEIQGKGSDQVTGDNRANFMLNANHKDAIRKTESDRRFCVFYTAQQSAADIVKAGMGGAYFPNLYRWLRAEGYAVINDYLRCYAIPDALNPATSCHRAPETSSTAEAVIMSRGGVEQELMEAIEEGRPGFKGGWVSSMVLDTLLKDGRVNNRIVHNKRREMLREFGYDYHPGLKDGRVNNRIPFENGKPRLYIKRGHIHSNLTEAAVIVKYYLTAQEYIPADGGTTIGRAEK